CKWGILVIHGVGDTGPCATVGALAPALAAEMRTLSLNSNYEVFWAGDEDEIHKSPTTTLLNAGSLQPSDKTFPIHLRRAEISGCGAVFAEVYWADLSRIREGALHLLLGVFRIIFGLRHVADQASSGNILSARVLRWLLHNGAFFVRGPLLALYLFLTSAVLL